MPEFGDFEDSVPAAELKVNSGNFTNKTDRKEAVYNPPPGWVIRSHNVQVLSAWGTHSYSVGQVGSASSFISESKVEEAYNYAISLAEQKGKEEEKKALQSQMQAHLNSLYSVKSSHYAVHAVVEAKGNGWLSDRTSQIHIKVSARIKYIGEDNAEALKQQLVTKFDLS